jgi:hypothetical protein
MKIGGPELPVKRPADTGNAGAFRSEVSHRGVPRGVTPQIAGFKELALSLGLPKDKLSSSLLSFIKFFSLPLDPKLIQQLRQEVLSLPVPQKDGGEKSTDRIRSGALAAAAAAGKGVVLSTEALGEYAAAITGDKRDSEDTDGSWDGDSGHRGTEQDGDAARDGTGQGGGGQTGGRRHPKDGLDTEQLRDMVERIEGSLPLLGILNKIPGRDGRRWITLPFSFNSGDAEFQVSLRLLLADTNTIPWKAECLALDIMRGVGDKVSRRWSFMLEGSGKKPQVFAQAVVGVHPPPEQPAALEGQLRELLGTVAEKIILKDMSEEAFLDEV